MKVNELLKEVKFKNTFNALYKNFYKKDNLPQHKIIELSMEFEKRFEDLVENEGREVEALLDKDILAAHVLFSLKK